MSPAESLDPVARLRVLAAALPGAVIAERTLAATFDQVWRVVTDLERMVPRYESSVKAIKVVDRQGQNAEVVATLRDGDVEVMDVRMVPGWCLMQSESTVVAFGARPEGHRTVLAHLEHNRRLSSARKVPMPEEAHAKLVREIDTIGSLAVGLDRPAQGESGGE
jgi:hypothetical protein